MIKVMAYVLGDIFIGDFPVTQTFGARPEVYSARYGLKGHNGEDFGVPSLTMILSAADGFVSEIGFDAAGYGKYVKIVHNGFLTLYAHLNDIVVQKGDRVVAGQLIAHSNNTGFSDAPHLHFGVAPCDANGIKTEADNGYSGYIDPLSSLCEWQIKNLTAPITPSAETPQAISVPSSDFTTMVAQGSNYKVIASFLLTQGLNSFLTNNGIAAVDIVSNPNDPTAGENIVKFLGSIFAEVQDLKNKQNNTPTPDQTISQTVDQVQNLPTEVKTSLLASITSSITSAIKNFVFVQKGQNG